MKKYVFEITLTEEDLSGDELWEGIMENTTSEGVSEIKEALQEALLGNYTLFSQYKEDEAKESVKLKSFSDD